MRRAPSPTGSAPRADGSSAPSGAWPACRTTSTAATPPTVAYGAPRSGWLRCWRSGRSALRGCIRARRTGAQRPMNALALGEQHPGAQFTVEGALTPRQVDESQVEGLPVEARCLRVVHKGVITRSFPRTWDGPAGLMRWRVMRGTRMARGFAKRRRGTAEGPTARVIDAIRAGRGSFSVKSKSTSVRERGGLRTAMRGEAPRAEGERCACRPPSTGTTGNADRVTREHDRADRRPDRGRCLASDREQAQDRDEHGPRTCHGPTTFVTLSG